MKTKLEIIEETKNYYSEDTSRRATNSHGGCVYKHPENGNCCAVGRSMVAPTNGGSDHNSKWSYGVDKMFWAGKLEQELKDEYKGHEIGFWADLQSFHDNTFNWDINSMSDIGVKCYNKLVEKYGSL